MQTEQVELRPMSNEYVSAVRSVRRAKTIAWLAIGAAILMQLTCFILARFGGLLEDLQPPGARAVSRAATCSATECATRLAATTATKQAATQAVPESKCYSFLAYHRPIRWIFDGTKCAAPAAGLALVLFLLAATQISLAGRLGGAGGFASATVWSILLLMFLIPWQDYLGGWLAGVMCRADEVRFAMWTVQGDWSAGEYFSPEVLAHLARFILYPVLALLAWLMVGMRFATGMRAVNETTAANAPAVPQPVHPTMRV
jgi:hypothetical protein